uniref:11 kDa protein n=1 Tax=Human parvovirus B19 TaxID=10798 RepID=A1BMK7_PAVHB|nr:11 kDa protein [Human parvovirus B19]
MQLVIYHMYCMTPQLQMQSNTTDTDMKSLKNCGLPKAVCTHCKHSPPCPLPGTVTNRPPVPPRLYVPPPIPRRQPSIKDTDAVEYKLLSRYEQHVIRMLRLCNMYTSLEK